MSFGLVYLTWDFLFFSSFFLQVYPKVKVRDQLEEDDQFAYGLGSLPSLKAFDAISISDLSSPGAPLIFIPKLFSHKSSLCGHY